MGTTPDCARLVDRLASDHDDVADGLTVHVSDTAPIAQHQDVVYRQRRASALLLACGVPHALSRVLGDASSEVLLHGTHSLFG